MAERAQTVDRALDVLDLVAGMAPVNVAQLSRSLGLSRSVVLRLINSLESAGLVRRDSTGISLGYGLLRLASGIARPLRDAARRPLESLADTFDETAVLSIRDGDAVLAVDQVVPERRLVAVRYGPGTRHPLGQGAHGRVLGGEGVGGTCRTDGELEPGVTGVAAPVVDAAGTVVAAIGLVAPTPRFPDESSVAAAVLAAARETSRRLGAVLVS